MQNPKSDELMIRVIFFIAGVYLLIKLILPIYSFSYTINPDIKNKELYYEQVLSNANESISIALPERKQNYKISNMLFSCITDTDNNNPISYVKKIIPSLNVNLPVVEPISVIPDDEDENTSDNSTIEKDTKKTISKTQEKIIKPISEPVKKHTINFSKPEVLVLHSHTRECYNPDNNKEANFSTNLGITVAKVGEALCNELEDKYGITTIHDVSIHDLPTRSGSYNRARPTILEYIKKYPSIKLIIDLHRDGDVKKSVYTAIINNQKYARVMFVVGTKFKNHEKYNKATKNFENVIDHLYPGFSRGIDYKQSNNTYNQDINPNMLLIEIGSNENSLEEAIRTTSVVGKAIATYLR